MVFALIVASRKLRPYFQANLILVMTDQPIKKSMNKPRTRECRSSAMPRTSLEKSCRERLEKKILRAMIESLGKVKGKVRREED